MMLGRVLPLTVAKEIRALLPLWVGCLALLAAGPNLSNGALRTFAILFYFAGSVALGAVSIGHEYTHRTLPQLLSLPSHRARVLSVKLTVLALMLLTSAAVAWSTVFDPSGQTVAMVVLAVLCGLFVAPWLTMLTRSPLAGTVLTLTIPGFLWIGALLVFGEALQPVVFWSVMLGFCATAGVLGWRTFLRLEAIEGRGSDVRLPWPRPATTAPARDRHALWLLMKKELALQQLSFALAVFYVAGWLTLVVSGKMQPGAGDHAMDVFGGLTILYGAMLTLLIGSLASAEERQLGALEWQVLLPMASWKQWAVKAGMAIGLAMLLAVGLPALLLLVSGIAVRTIGWYACAILLLASVSLYVSSLSRSGIGALLLSVAVSLFVVLPAIALLSRLGWMELTLPRMGLLAVALALVLYFALLNHRSTERGAWRICVQVVCIASCFAFCGALAAILKTS